MQYIYSVKVNKQALTKQEYPFNLPCLHTMNELVFHPNVTFIVGENGSGKSTLLEALAVKAGFNPEGGTKFISFATRESHSNLYEHITIHKHYKHPENHFFLRAESFYNVATKIDSVMATHNYGGKSLHEQSHGESFFSVFLHRFGPDGLYVLDEPEAALSPNRQIAMLSRIHQLVEQNCQFVIATHSPILLSYPDALIYEIGEGGMNVVTYEESDLFMTTKYFMDNYKNIHKELFREE